MHRIMLGKNTTTTMTMTMTTSTMPDMNLATRSSRR
jgi:hypothetical protein